MKRFILFLVLVLTCLCTYSQHTVYCEIMQFSPGGPKSIISVDFGNNGSEELLDENGKKIKFHSSIAALAFFEKLGWSVLTAFSVIHNTGVANVPVVHYLLKKEVAQYDDKMQGIHTKGSQPPKKLELKDEGYFY